MFKKLLVFTLAFGLGLMSLQIIKQKIKPIEVIPNTPILNESTPSISVSETSQKSISLFEECVRKFKKAVAENDRETIASLIRFPLTFGFMDKKEKTHFVEIKNSAEFLASYDKIFDDSAKQSINQMESEHLDAPSCGIIPQFGYVSTDEFFNRSSIRISRRIYSFSIIMNRIFKNDGTNYEVKIVKFPKAKF